MTATTLTILERIAAGEKPAVQECLDQYGGLVWSLARRFSADRSDAEDAAQEVFVDLWKNAGQFDASRGSETTFVAMLARRRLIDRWRKRQREGSLGLSSGGMDASEGFEVAAGGHKSASREGRAVEIAEEAAMAARVLDSLGEDQRKVLKLSIHHGWSHEKIAEVTGLPLGTVKTHVRRGLIRIREMIGASQRESVGGKA